VSDQKISSFARKSTPTSIRSYWKRSTQVNIASKTILATSRGDNHYYGVTIMTREIDIMITCSTLAQIYSDMYFNLFTLQMKANVHLYLFFCSCELKRRETPTVNKDWEKKLGLLAVVCYLVPDCSSKCSSYTIPNYGSGRKRTQKDERRSIATKRK
jgi:hypothetical protein